MLHNKYIVKPEQIVEYQLLTEQRAAEQLGHGSIVITSNLRKNMLKELSENGVIAETIDQQTKSLDEWIDYLLSDDETYPDWFKYYVFRSILNLTAYDNQEGKFLRRSAGKADRTTVKNFPELNREALAQVLDYITKQLEKNTSESKGNTLAAVRKTIQGVNFATLYAQKYREAIPSKADRLTVTEGEWIKYDQGSDPKLLFDSLSGHGTGWCTASEATAAYQLQHGDFYVYYSLDEHGKPTIPRVAIRMKKGASGENRIAEVRGIAANQNLDPYIGDIVQKKLAEFPDGKVYQKRATDMHELTRIENKMNAGEKLTREELIFLYEINDNIVGFGYNRDPRIKELRDRRDSKKDALVVFDCKPEEIAWSPDEVSTQTKAYVGPLFAGIFQKKGIEHIYTTFPEGKMTPKRVITGTSSGEELSQAIIQN
jgi:hypothetical protein